MTNMYVIQTVSPLQQVASSKTTSGNMGMRTIVMREIGGKWTNTYAVKVFSPQAETNYQPGQMVAACLRFRVSTNQVSGQVYQDVVAEEIVPICTPTTSNINETFKIPF